MGTGDHHAGCAVFALLTIWAGEFFVVGTVLCLQGVQQQIPPQNPLDVTSMPIPEL